MGSKTNIVVSRYNKNVDFAYRINNGNAINVLIYDKENQNIIDTYDNLSDFTFFIHDEEYSWSP